MYAFCKIAISLVCLLLLNFSVHAQDAAPTNAPPDTVDGRVLGWNNTLTAGLNLTQVSLHNWTQGGENTFAWSFLTNGAFIYNARYWILKNTLKIAYGQTKIADADFEKTDDELFQESQYSYIIGWAVNPYAANQVKTQFAPGYTEIKNEEGEVIGREQSSGFFDPGYLIQSVGFSYEPSEEFSTRAGVAVKETFSSEFGYADDAETEDEIETVMVETGIESATSVKLTIMENILYTSKLNLFSAFDKLDQWDVRWDNQLTAKVNKYVAASVSVTVVHAVAETRRTQVKQVLALSLTYSVF